MLDIATNHDGQCCCRNRSQASTLRRAGVLAIGSPRTQPATSRDDARRPESRRRGVRQSWARASTARRLRASSNCISWRHWRSSSGNGSRNESWLVMARVRSQGGRPSSGPTRASASPEAVLRARPRPARSGKRRDVSASHRPRPTAGRLTKNPLGIGPPRKPLKFLDVPALLDLPCSINQVFAETRLGGLTTTSQARDYADDGHSPSQTWAAIPGVEECAPVCAFTNESRSGLSLTREQR